MTTASVSRTVREVLYATPPVPAVATVSRAVREVLYATPPVPAVATLSQTVREVLYATPPVPAVATVSQTVREVLCATVVRYPRGPYPLRLGATVWLQHGAEPPYDPIPWIVPGRNRSRLAAAISRTPRPRPYPLQRGPEMRADPAPWLAILDIHSRLSAAKPPSVSPHGPYPLRQGAALWLQHGAAEPADPILGFMWRRRRVSPLLPQVAVRASQLVLEALVRADWVPVRVSQQIAQALIRADGVPSRVSQALLSVLLRGNPVPPRVSQALLSILVWSCIVSTTTTGSLAVFPSLPGLAFDVVKRPTFYTASAKSASGYQVRVGYATAPTWEWDLTYEFLKDATAASDLKQLLGFWLAMQGDLKPFLFQDPDDYAVTRQAVGTGDGSTTTFTLYRTYGSGQTGTEPIGYVNGAEPFNVYLNGTLVASSTYTIVSTTPMAQQIKFTSAPASGAVITADFSFYYFVHFKENTNEWTKFMNQLWDMKKLTLESLRG